MVGPWPAVGRQPLMTQVAEATFREMAAEYKNAWLAVSLDTLPGATRY